MKRLLYFLLAIVLLSSCADGFGDAEDYAPEFTPDNYYNIEDPVSGLNLTIHIMGNLGEIVHYPEWIQRARVEMYEKAPNLIYVYDVTYNGGRYVFLHNTVSTSISGRNTMRLYRLDGEEVSMANIGGEELSGQVRISPREKGK